MNILLNFFPVQSGGGQQVATTFIRVVAKNDFGHKWFVLVGENSELHLLAMKLFPEDQILFEKYSYLSRIVSAFKIRSFVTERRIDLVYNYAPVLSISGVPQVVRSVYSNLYFPEVNFWGSYSKKTQIKKKIIDFLRLKGTLKADGLIFENESMLSRSISLYRYPEDCSVYIAPSVSSFDESQVDPKYSYIDRFPHFKILYLSSWHLNKNIHLLPDVASHLLERDLKVKFILSLCQSDSNIPASFFEEIKAKRVEDYFEFIGKVEARFVHQVINSADAMILLSKLECFSSNVVESFYFQKPLLISREEWATSACQDACIYVDRDSPKDICDKIALLMTDKALYSDVIELGKLRLNDFNTPENKVRLQVRFLEYIRGKYEVGD